MYKLNQFDYINGSIMVALIINTLYKKITFNHVKIYILTINIHFNEYS
jgi:hypothetical protein